MSGLDQIHNGQEISISAESAVDAARAFSNFEGAIQHAHDVSAMIASSSLNDATKHAFTEALSTSKIDEIMKIAAAAGADEGNQKLVIGRWAE